MGDRHIPSAAERTDDTAVRAQLDGQRLRVEACDQGGLWRPPTRGLPDEQNGRGLLIVSQLASRWGCAGHSKSGWTVWFEIDTRP
jgi:hypothetical protein